MLKLISALLCSFKEIAWPGCQMPSAAGLSLARAGLGESASLKDESTESKVSGYVSQTVKLLIGNLRIGRLLYRMRASLKVIIHIPSSLEASQKTITILTIILLSSTPSRTLFNSSMKHQTVNTKPQLRLCPTPYPKVNV